MKVIYIPLENLEQRYTKMMNDAIIPLVDMSLYPNVPVSTNIKKGQFLDIVGTCKFKAAQLAMIAELFENEQVNDGDAFLIGDLFFPGIEMIKYMAELQKLNVKVYGINYAGRADQTDFVQQLGMWADASEEGWHMLCDGIFVGSEFHKDNVVEFFGLKDTLVHPTGYVWDLNYMDSFKEKIGEIEKENFVIWPHRFSKEKGIDELIAFARSTTKKIIVTTSGPTNKFKAAVADYCIKSAIPDLPENLEYRTNLTKLEYFTLMAKAKWYLSTAYQETFGYTIQEAIYFGCNILVPNRACCPEMVPEKNVYTDVNQIDTLFSTQDLTVSLEYTVKWHNNAKMMVDIIKGNIK